MTTSSDSCSSVVAERKPETVADDSKDKDDTAAAVGAEDASAGSPPIAAAASENGLSPQDVDGLSSGIKSLQEATTETGTVPSDADDATVALVSPADDSVYWDPSSMAPLNARSAAAIARLRAFKSPAFPVWDRLPLSRRAAVLVLLYADRRGDLRVVLTMRAASLRNYSGHAAFPGGKADTLEETPYEIARREAWEEIGLPLDDGGLPRPFWIEHLCNLPHNLAKTELVVRPCVAFLHSSGSAAGTKRPAGETANSDETPAETANSDETATTSTLTPTAADLLTAESLRPRLDAKEVAAVFSAPFHNFLLETDEVDPADRVPLSLTHLDTSSTGPLFRPKLPPGPWYEGSWITFHEVPWKMHFFYVPVVGQRLAKPKKRRLTGESEEAGGGEGEAPDKDKEASNVRVEPNTSADEIEDSPGRYKVWGMTGRMLVDAAKVAYDETPEFEHNAHFGDEKTIAGLEKMGRLKEKEPRQPERPFTTEEVKKAAKM